MESGRGRKDEKEDQPAEEAEKKGMQENCPLRQPHHFFETLQRAT